MPPLSTDRRYQGRRISVDLDTIQYPDGSSGVLEIVRHPGAAAVVPFLDEVTAPDPRILLIRQYRHAADGYLWEIPAGTLEVEETPADCAERELLEEAGVEAEDFWLLTSLLTTPGFTDEIIHLYIATGLTEVAAAPEPDEYLEVHEIRWSQVGRMIREGQIRDAKTLVALMYVQCFLRGTAATGAP